MHWLLGDLLKASNFSSQALEEFGLWEALQPGRRRLSHLLSTLQWLWHRVLLVVDAHCWPQPSSQHQDVTISPGNALWILECADSYRNFAELQFKGRLKIGLHDSGTDKYSILDLLEKAIHVLRHVMSFIQESIDMITSYLLHLLQLLHRLMTPDLHVEPILPSTAGCSCEIAYTLRTFVPS